MTIPSHENEISFTCLGQLGIGQLLELLITQLFLSYFFVKKIPLSRRVAYVLHGSMGESVRDVCMSHQSDWIYYKQSIKFLVVKVNGI